MNTYNIACIPGDGIGKEVIPAGQTVLETLAASRNTFNFEFENFAWGGEWYRRFGEMMPANGLDALRSKDAILFGSAGDPGIPITSPCGACGSRFARDLTSMPMCAPPAYCRVSMHPSNAVNRKISTGSSFAKLRR